jgi:hypothetical protein
MEGRASTFEKVLADFESKLAKADYVAIDTELTGVDIEGEIDTYEETALTRLQKICRVAERYSLIQLGLTLVSRSDTGQEGSWSCSSYNFFPFPEVIESRDFKKDPVFMCQVSALGFNARHRVDFNTWIGQGIPYMTREEEKLLRASQSMTDEEIDQKAGVLRLWKALCAARLPFVIHCPLDLFFLLASFERRPLPKDDPKALAFLIRQCTPKVYDTAHLYGVLGRFRRLGLSKFFEDAKARYDDLIANENTGILPVEFHLHGETAVRYSRTAEQMAHEAGYDSLMTAQLFAYLRTISPMRVKEAANRLFLYRSIEFIDIERAAAEGIVGSAMFDLSRVTLLVAVLDPSDVMHAEAPRLIASVGYEYKWMDSTHILVVLRASGGAAVRKARDLASQVHGVASWIGFDEWRDAQITANNAVESLSNGYTNGGRLKTFREDIASQTFVTNFVAANGAVKRVSNETLKVAGVNGTKTLKVAGVNGTNGSANGTNGEAGRTHSPVSRLPESSTVSEGLQVRPADTMRWTSVLRRLVGLKSVSVLILLSTLILRLRRRWPGR